MKTIFLVEDDADVRDALQGALRAEGYDVVTFEHSQSVWDQLCQVDVYPALILLDLMTPVLTGWRFLERIRADQPAWAKVPIVVFSAATVSEGTDFAPAVDFVRKPIDLIDLIQVIEKRLIP